MRIAVVGVGRMGSRHLAAVGVLPGVTVAGTLDHRPHPGLRSYADLASLIADGVDGVVVATPPADHVEVALPLLQAGVAVLVEKPLALDVTGCEVLVAAAQASDALLAVGFVERFNAALDGPRAVAARRFVTHRTVTTAGAAHQGIDVLLDLAVHDVDLVRWLTGAEYTSVQVHHEARDAEGRLSAATLLGVLSDGRTAEHHVGWSAALRRRELDHGELVDLGAPEPTGSSLLRQAAAFASGLRGRGTDRLALGPDGLAATQVVSDR